VLFIHTLRVAKRGCAKDSNSMHKMFKLKTVDVSHSDANRLANVEVPGICKFKMATSRHLKAINSYYCKKTVLPISII